MASTRPPEELLPADGVSGRAFAWLLSHRAAGALVALSLTLLLGLFAARVRPDYSVEQLFPAWDPTREAFERYRAQFPMEDARAVVLVQAPGLLSGGGLRRLEALEGALRAVPGVVEVRGPPALARAVKGPMGPTREQLLSPELPADELARRLEQARQDPLVRWNVLPPEGDEAAAILVGIDPAAASSDGGRQGFVAAAQAVLEREQRPGERLVLTGVPVIKAQIVRMLSRDLAVLLPLAIGLVLVLLHLAFRSTGAVLAGLGTILASVVWSYGVAGLLGWPATMVMGVLPIIVVIVSVSDTVHIITDYLARLRAGEPARAALVAAMAESAGPCLVTELVLAAGFLSLLFVGILAVVQFAVCAAAAMLLTWAANVLVLPLLLSRVTRAPATKPPRLLRLLERPLGWIAGVATSRPRTVLAVAAVLFLGCAAAAGGVKRLYLVFDDLRPGSELEGQIRLAERVHGGLVLSAIHLEVDGEGPSPALEPEVVRLAERASRFLLTIPEYRQVNSVADVLRPMHLLLGGDDPEVLGDGLPDSREGAVQELATLGDPLLTREFLSADGRSLAVVGRAIDAGSERIAAIFDEIEAWVAREQAAMDARPDGPRVRISATGQMRVFKDVNDLLLTGLIGSFGTALLVSFVLMSLALRSLRLGLVALVPNATPIVLVLAFMALAGIPLTPVTVMVFSITLVIADDDTIQFMARFRRAYLARKAAAEGESEEALHREAALQTLREAGTPMLVSGVAVSLGFLVLVFSEFLGPARLGVLIAATLFAAVFADLFLSPILLAWLRPLGKWNSRSISSSPGLVSSEPEA